MDASVAVDAVEEEERFRRWVFTMLVMIGFGEKAAPTQDTVLDNDSRPRYSIFFVVFA